MPFDSSRYSQRGGLPLSQQNMTRPNDASIEAQRMAGMNSMQQAYQMGNDPLFQQQRMQNSYNQRGTGQMAAGLRDRMKPAMTMGGWFQEQKPIVDQGYNNMQQQYNSMAKPALNRNQMQVAPQDWAQLRQQANANANNHANSTLRARGPGYHAPNTEGWNSRENVMQSVNMLNRLPPVQRAPGLKDPQDGFLLGSGVAGWSDRENIMPQIEMLNRLKPMRRANPSKPGQEYYASHGKPVPRNPNPNASYGKPVPTNLAGNIGGLLGYWD